MPEEVTSEISGAGAGPGPGLSNPSRNVYIFLVLASHLTAEFFVSNTTFIYTYCIFQALQKIFQVS